MKTRTILFIWAGALFAAAIALFALERFGVVKFDNIIRAGDLLGACVAVVLLATLNILMIGATGRRKSVGDYVIDMAKNVLKEAVRLDEVIRSTPLDETLSLAQVHAINIAHSALSNSIHLLVDGVTLCKLNKEISLADVTGARESYSQVLDTPFPVKLDPGLLRIHNRCYIELQRAIRSVQVAVALR